MKKEKEKKYNFNVCIKCQKKDTDVPCYKNCIYLDEKIKKSHENLADS